MKEYQGQGGIEKLFSECMPYLLVRTDPRVLCVCADPQTKTGKMDCIRCLGTGKAVRSLDRLPMYFTSRPSRNPGPLGTPGYESVGISFGYTVRYAYLSEGDLILQVGWNVSPEKVYGRGLPQSIYKVFLVKEVEFPGFKDITYCMGTCVAADIRRPSLEDMLLFGPAEKLPPYKDIYVPKK